MSKPTETVPADSPRTPEPAPAPATAPSSSEHTYSEERLVDVVLRIGLSIVTAVTLVSVAFLAIVHIADRYNVNHVSGTWMALAMDVRDGILYRPFFEDGYYGLSAYMPLQFVLAAGGSLVTGEYLVSAKLLACISGLAIVALILLVLRWVGCPMLLSLALVAALLATDAGVLAVTGIHGDALPLALQLGALAIVLHSTSRRAAALAGCLCALAVVAKFTAIWAGLAIVLWLAVKYRRSLVSFLGAYLSLTVAALVLFEALSDGRLSKNFIEVFTPGGSASEGSVTGGVSTYFELVTAHAGAVWLLTPFAVLAVLQGIARRSLTLPQVALLCAVPVVVVVLGNPGSDFNHLVDIGALVVLVVGEQFAYTRRSVSTSSAIPALVCVAVILGVAQSYRVSMKSEVAHAAKVLVGREESVYATDTLLDYVGDQNSVLSEDPAIPVLRGERPILLDGLGLRRLGERHSELLGPLLDSLAGREFDRVVLVRPIEDLNWYHVSSMGTAVRDAIAANYVLIGTVPISLGEEYWVYGPRPASQSGASVP